MLLVLLVLATPNIHYDDALPLYVYDRTGNLQASASGVLIDETLVLTSAHVISSYKMTPLGDVIAVKCGADYIHGKYILKRNKTLDLLLLELERPCDKRIIPLATEEPEFASTVYAVGAPNGNSGVATMGIISDFRYRGGYRWIISDAAAYFGNSGGPLLNEKGELVGICNALGTYNKRFRGHKEYVYSFSFWNDLQEIKKFLAD